MRFDGFYRFTLVLFLLILVSASVSAFDIDPRPINNTIDRDGTAVFEFDITNRASSSSSFTVSSSDFRWNILSDPLSDYFSGFRIDEGETYTLQLRLNPRGDLFYGRYRVTVEFRSRESGERKTVDLPIDLRSSVRDPVDYSPTVVVDGLVNTENEIDPRETSTLSLELDNRNPLNISELDVSIESEFINESLTTDLPPMERKVLEFKFDVDPREEPGVHDFVYRLRYDGEFIASTPSSFPVRVISYSDMEKDIDEKSGFLSSHRSIKLTNEGNVENEEEVKIESGLIQSIFTTTEPSPDIVREDGQRYMVWDMMLNPGSSATIDISVNYRPLIYLILLLGAVFGLYYMLRSPLVVKKSASSFERKEEGISDVKILVHIRNRTSQNFNSFTVSEYVPKIASYVKSESLGSILPSKVLNHEKKGTLLKWEFDAIEPFEERIIIYKMKLNFAVLGRLNLPPTVVKFKDESSTRYTSKSNRLKMNGSKEEKDK